MATSFLDTPEAETSSEPRYLTALNLHNKATGNDSVLSGIQETLSGIGESIKNAPKFWGAAAVSGGIGVVNSGIAIADWVTPGNLEQISVQKWLTEYDSDLGKYYRENATSVDAVGFVLSSLVPGTLGVKALNVGQKALRTVELSGTMGTNLSRATGLLIPKTEAYIAKSAEVLAQTNLRYKVMEANSLKALASGVQQNVLEAAAFETFALAATFKSNFITEMEAGDVAENFATGVLLGGAIGGVIAGFKTFKGIKESTIKLDAPGAGAMAQASIPESVPANVKTAQHFLNREGVENWQLANKAGPAPGELLPDGRTLEVLNHQVKNSEHTVTDINNKIRESIKAITPNQYVANDFADTIIKLPSRNGANVMLGAEELLRVGDVKVPAVGRMLFGQRNLELAGTESIIDSATSGIQWNKMWGGRAGKTFDEMPIVNQMADRVKLGAGESVEKAVERLARSFKHTARKPVDVMGARGNLNEIQSRYLVADRFKLVGPQAIKESDIPVLEAAYAQFDQIGRVDLVGVKNEAINSAATKDELLTMITSAKDKVIARGKARNLPVDEIAERANVRAGYIDRTEVADSQIDNYFARQAYAKQAGVTTEQLAYKPSYMGVRQDKGIVEGLTDMSLDAETMIAASHKAAQDAINNAVAAAGSYLGQGEIRNMATGSLATKNFTEVLPTNQELQGALAGANRFGSGARLFSFSNGNYGDAESMVQYIGQIKREMDQVGTNLVRQEFEDVLRVIRTDTAASTELSLLNETLARMPVRYGLDPSSARLVPLAHLDDMAKGLPLRELGPGVLKDIPVKNPAVFEAAATHIKLNGQRVKGRQTLRAASSGEYTVDPRAFYPIKPDPQSTPFHAFVIDPTITGAGRSTMIHATSSDQLARMIKQVENDFPKWNVVTKNRSEDYHRAVGDYDYSKTMSDDYVDMSLRQRGINSQSFPQTDGKLVAGKFEDWHGRQVRGYNSEIISTKYASEFDSMESLGREFSNLTEANYPTISDLARSSKSNPYVEYVKTALNVSNMADYGWLTNTNRFLDSAVSNVWNRASAKIKEIKGVSKGELDAVNKVFEEGGFKTAYYDAATHLLANHPADSAVLSRFIRGANSLLATTFLRMDWLNSINNKIGSLVLTSTETRHVIDSIKKADAGTVGKLASLSETRVPGTTDNILTPSRLIARAYKEFWTDKNLVREAMESGIVPSDMSEAFKVVDNLTLNGTETSLQLNQKLEKAFEGAKAIGNFAEKWTGNKLVEGMNRYVSYSVMRQLTDLAQGAGIMTKTEAKSYINTFVNRTQVNLNAAQRPLVFQGPVGMAMGLFQSYQFNLMQQLFRYAGDGAGKTAAYMMGMQGSMYGLNGLPGYQAFNENIIGQAAGNYEHKDITTSVYEAAGNDIAQFLLYGAPSNLLRANLYTRGDLTPQHSTILPNSIGDIAAVSMYGKFFGNLKTTASNIAGGADIWKSILSGLEHNSMNRPLSGLAQTLRGFENGNVYSTDSSGNVIASNDLLSLGTLARLAGGKPIDEAVVRDEKWRISAYRQSDLARRAKATQALRTSMTDAGEASNAQLDSVFDIYLQTGGKTADFNKWVMTQYNKANVSDSDKLANSLTDPYSYRMQLLMGGSDAVQFAL